MHKRNGCWQSSHVIIDTFREKCCLGPMVIPVVLSSLISVMLLGAGAFAKGLDNCPTLSLFPERLQLPILFFEIIIQSFIIYVLTSICVKRVRRVPKGHLIDAIFSSRLIITIIILCSWIPWIYLQYPASIDWDTYNQLTQFFTDSPTFYTTKWVFIDAKYIDHHPVFDTLLFGGFYYLGLIIGHENFGLFLFSIIQTIGLAFALSYSLSTVYNMGLKSSILGIGLVVFCLYPLFPAYGMTMLKDSIFSVVFIYYFVSIILIWNTNGSILSDKAFVRKLFLQTLFLCLTKKPGFIIATGCSIALCIAYRKNVKTLILSTLAPIVLVVAVIPLLYPLCSVAPGGGQETLGPFIQQVVSVIKDGKAITGDEYDSIRRCYDIEKAIEKYQPNLVDGTKNAFLSESTLSDKVSFLSAWFRIGLRHPIVYAKSLLKCSGALILPGWEEINYRSTPMQSKWTIELFEEKEGVILHYQKPRWSEKASTIVKGWIDALFQMPIMSVVLSKAFFIWITLHFLCLILLSRKLSPVVYIPILMSLLILMISPNSDSRYALPLSLTWHLTASIYLLSIKDCHNQPVEQHMSHKTKDGF